MEIYKITDVEKMAAGLREFCFENDKLGTPSPDVGYDGYVTIPQICQMIAESAKADDGGFYITEEGIAEVRDKISQRVVSTALARIAALGHIEVGFEDGEFTFWKAGGDGNAIRTVA